MDTDPKKHDCPDNDVPSRPRILINPPVFFVSSLLALVFVGFAASMPDTADHLFGAVRDWTIHSAGWFYVLSVAGFLTFVVVIAASSMGTIKLGRDHSDGFRDRLYGLAATWSDGPWYLAAKYERTDTDTDTDNPNAFYGDDQQAFNLLGAYTAGGFT